MTITDLDGDALSRAIHAQEVSCREVMQRVPRRASPRSTRATTRSSACGRRRPAAPRPMRATPRSRAATSLRAADASACRRRSRTSCRPKGIPHHARLAAAARLRAGRRRADGRAHEGGRLHRRRQDQHARVRPRLAHLQRGLRRDPQRLRSDTIGGRQQRRRGGRAGDADAAGRRRQRLRWAACATPPAGTTSSASGRARAACRAGAGAGRVGDATSAPKDRWRARSRTSPLLLDVQAGYDRARAAVARVRAVVRGPPRRAPTRDARRCRIGWLGDLDGYLAMEDGIVDALQERPRSPRVDRLRGRADRARLRARAHLADAWLVWRWWMRARPDRAAS